MWQNMGDCSHKDECHRKPIARTENQESEIMKMTPNKHDIQFINV